MPVSQFFLFLLSPGEIASLVIEFVHAIDEYLNGLPFIVLNGFMGELRFDVRQLRNWFSLSYFEQFLVVAIVLGFESGDHVRV